jgi:hypothetical protein
MLILRPKGKAFWDAQLWYTKGVKGFRPAVHFQDFAMRTKKQG